MIADRDASTPERELDVDGIVGALRPLIKASEERMETERTIPRELADALYEHGVLRAMVPREVGGLEANPVEWLDLVEEVSRVNGSVGWLAMVQNGAACLLAPDVMKRLIAEHGPWIIAGGSRPGKARRVDGGYRVTGRWPFASGAPHATFHYGFALIVDDDNQPVTNPETGAPQLVVCCWPAAQGTFHDTWDGLGLRASGSGDIEIQDMFLPAEQVSTFVEYVRNWDRPNYRTLFVLMGHAAHAVGVARAAIDAFIDVAHRKAMANSRRQVRFGRQQLHQVAVAEADAIVRAARLLAWDATARAYENAQTNDIVDYELRVLMAEANVFTMRAARQAVDLVFTQAGTDAVFRGRELERCFRDIATAAQHTAVAESSYETIGQYYLTRGQPGGPFIDVANSFILPPHPQPTQAIGTP